MIRRPIASLCKDKYPPIESSTIITPWIGHILPKGVMWPAVLHDERVLADSHGFGILKSLLGSDRDLYFDGAEGGGEGLKGGSGKGVAEGGGRSGLLRKVSRL
jgi:hypothetical protein